MQKMRVANFGLKTNLKNNSNVIELTFNLPMGTEILSVSTTKESHEIEHTVWFTELAPAEAWDEMEKDSYPWIKYHFLLIPCRYTVFEFDDHKYIGNILDNTFAVFYKPGEGEFVNVIV